MATVEDPNQLTAGDRISFHIKIPRISFTIAPSNINQMIQDFDHRIGPQFGTPKIIEEPDPKIIEELDENDPDSDSVFFSEAWPIKYAITKVFDPGARIFLEAISDTEL